MPTPLITIYRDRDRDDTNRTTPEPIRWDQETPVVEWAAAVLNATGCTKAVGLVGVDARYAPPPAAPGSAGTNTGIHAELENFTPDQLVSIHALVKR